MRGSNKDSSVSLRIRNSTVDHAEQVTLATAEIVGAHAALEVIAIDQTGGNGGRISTLLQLACIDHIAIVVKGDAGSIESLTSVSGTSSDGIDVARVA